ncbi:GntR family transcriptional regulator [Limoniibacter endophyticus]|uniref:GntR family transcriptional regulator n=1 Tax=Limoniibacter endophyticus TaxID=1565040 RepID=A0A8J3DKP7_9HYPH|nr:GntR family transcriptional regulator [Limoniibacter endophyticus]GHC77020.1 GntR family transcriptional regulator [Limoniibacter endophyticus]
MDGTVARNEQEDRVLLEPIKVRSLREHVHEELRQAIISGRLRTGLKLNERQLASELGTSTSPLKEALRQLEAEGLVRTEPRRGSFVTFSERQAEEMTLARAALESIIARQAAKHASEEAFDQLRSVIEEMRLVVEAGSINELIGLNERFHDAVHEASGCDYLRRLQNAQRTYNHAARKTVLSREDVRRASFLEHEAIMKAIVTRNEDEAERLMREHILLAGKTHIELVF